MTPEEKNRRARTRYHEKKEGLTQRKRELYAEKREDVLRRMREDRTLCPLCHMPYRRLYLKKHLLTRHLRNSTTEVRQAALEAFPELAQPPQLLEPAVAEPVES